MPKKTEDATLIIHSVARNHKMVWLRDQHQNDSNRVFFVSETQYPHLLRLHYVIKNTAPLCETRYDIKAEILLRNDIESSAEKIIEKLLQLGVLHKPLLFVNHDKEFLSFALKTHQLLSLPRVRTPRVYLDELADIEPAPIYPRSPSLFPKKDGEMDKKETEKSASYGTFTGPR